MANLGQIVIGGAWESGEENPIYATNPKSNQPLPQAFHSASLSQTERACTEAGNASAEFSKTAHTKRGDFLRAIGEGLQSREPDIVQFGTLETGLPEARLKGELQRTIGQLNLFADLLVSGRAFETLHDEPLPDRAPLPRPDLRLVKRAIGPIAVFGASNFPLAFSVAGGDTASAFAAGCPVIVKAHSSHPYLSYFAASAITEAVKKTDMPAGVFSMVYGSGNTVGSQLVTHPAVKGVGFTGSKQGGLALNKLAQSRNVPIPVFAEMSSVNPVFLSAKSLAEHSELLAKGLSDSVCLGAGQFCTNPGLVLVCEGSETEPFVQKLTVNTHAQPAQTMLNKGICQAYYAGVERLESLGATVLKSSMNTKSGADTSIDSSENQCEPALYRISGKQFLAAPNDWQPEVFGASTLVVVAKNEAEILAILQTLEGQLTVTFWLDAEDDPDVHQPLISQAEQIAGRIIFNGFPTGVEVCQSMVHGGPYPATTNGQFTSVGSTAIERWLRPVCFQNAPDWV
ncbi:aldehyde dehydrogenase (NADP(+)) [Vibrio penaeicida]|uniref:2,5-dioxovalerate dehydrogenase n=1 Tax=Vibrio penaeicida TaxID=104609 RepID=A0AAV5NPE8_9VIBR|nr:aldehyde dehydrogenase (NADP(+)) [Vibrio penaeicida]RTZ19542.1 aldehyde dehydrogenase (NADP(+)) [Vibrio penaeicida]GLQ72128.1 2,5-dioxovalerate dehydrogenase [Vibrio penaeicida]